MKSSFVVLLIVGSFLFSSCSKISDPAKSIETPNVNVPEPTLPGNPQEAFEASKDTFACGGPAGKISLSGVFATESNKSDSFLTIQQYPGKGWRAECKAPKTEPVERISDLSESTLKGLEDLKDNKHYILVGCDRETISSKILDGLTEIEPSVDYKNVITTLVANTIILCGDKDTHYNTMAVSMQAYTMWVRGFDYKLTGTSASILSITAKNFGFSGSFGINSVGLDGSTTVLGGPSIYLAAQNFLNTPEKSYVRAEGSNYLESVPK